MPTTPLAFASAAALIAFAGPAAAEVLGTYKVEGRNGDIVYQGIVEIKAEGPKLLGVFTTAGAKAEPELMFGLADGSGAVFAFKTAADDIVAMIVEERPGTDGKTFDARMMSNGQTEITTEVWTKAAN